MKKYISSVFLGVAVVLYLFGSFFISTVSASSDKLKKEFQGASAVALQDRSIDIKPMDQSSQTESASASLQLGGGDVQRGYLRNSWVWLGVMMVFLVCLWLSSKFIRQKNLKIPPIQAYSMRSLLGTRGK